MWVRLKVKLSTKCIYKDVSFSGQKSEAILHIFSCLVVQTAFLVNGRSCVHISPVLPGAFGAWTVVGYCGERATFNKTTLIICVKRICLPAPGQLF